MDKPVDLTNLRTITEGDPDMEKGLFMEFLESSKKSLDDLRGSLEANANDKWRLCSHALKGNSLNLGAVDLSDLCKKAQDAYLSSKAEKEELLKALHAEYLKVHDYLMNLSKSA